jgi:hypothetical protein
VSLETCQTAGNLYDNFIFKTTMALFNLEYTSTQSSLLSNPFRSLLTQKLSIETRILQLPFQFFLRSDLKQPINVGGKKINAPFHHVDGNELNNILSKLVEQKILRIVNYIVRPRAQSTHSYMKNPVPDDPQEEQQFQYHLNDYKISIDEYRSLLARTTLPNKCILSPEGINLLTSSYQHRDDCVKYGLTSKSM